VKSTYWMEKSTCWIC